MSKRKYGSLALAAVLALSGLALGLFSLRGTPVIAQVAEDCSNGIDDDKDKLIDCKDPDCFSSPKCVVEPPKGTPCSPGYWRHHTEDFQNTCVQVPGWTCDDLFTAIWCKGSNASCRRQEATDALNAINGCTESD